MPRLAPYLALTLVGLAGCRGDYVRKAAAQTPLDTPNRGSDVQPAASPRQVHELRRVWSGSDFNFYWNEPSPDGRYVSEIDWESGSVAVRDLVTGELVPVSRQTGQEGFAYGSVFSPDGTQLAYRWAHYTPERFELRTIGVDGSDPRVLVGVRPDITSILPTDWSADGGSLLVAVGRPDNTVQLALLAVADGSMRVLKSLGWRWPAEALLSPDGRYVAYSFHQASSAADADPPDLRILAVDGSSEVQVAPDPAAQRMLGWTPDGQAVLFYRRERSYGSIWQVSIRDGRQVGEPILIEPDVRVSSIGFSRDAYYFGTQVESPQVHVAPFDPVRGGFLAEPRAVGEPGGPATDLGAWSGDGTQLAYVRRELSGVTLIVRAVGGVEERAIPLSTLEGIRDVVWAPDGESVLVMGFGRGRLRVGLAVYRVDLTSGDATFVVAGPGPMFPGGLAVGPRGDAIYLGKQGEGVVRYDVGSGAETLVHPDSVTIDIHVAASPDGSMIAFSAGWRDRELNRGAEDRILVMPASGQGEAREVFRTEWPGHIERNTSITWTADGRELLFVRGDEGIPHVLSRVSVDGGAVADVLEFPCESDDCQPHGVRVSPDGRSIAFRHGVLKGEIWMMTGFGVAAAAGGEPRSQ